jgi:hypothetical protein
MRLRTAVRAIGILVMVGIAMAGARGDSLALASVGTDSNPRQTNSKGYTIPVTKSREWALPINGSSWVSFAPTGDTADPKFNAVPFGTVVSFFDVFNISEYASGGTLQVMADDSASVLLNGTMICAKGLPIEDARATCPETAVGSRTPIIFDLPAKLLHIGANMLEFRVAQRKGVSFGLDYTGSVNFRNEIHAVGAAPFIGGGNAASPPPPTGGGGNPVGPPPPSGGGGPFDPQPPNGGGGPIPVPEPSILLMLCTGVLTIIVLAQWRVRNQRLAGARKFEQTLPTENPVAKSTTLAP